MGRPRKQPRRIVTFNLNIPLAEAIDNLPVKNRSEWANTALQGVLDNRSETSKEALDNLRLDVAAEAADAEREAILNNPKRAVLTALLALERANLDTVRAYQIEAGKLLKNLMFNLEVLEE